MSLHLVKRNAQPTKKTNINAMVTDNVLRRGDAFGNAQVAESSALESSHDLGRNVHNVFNSGEKHAS